MQPKINPYLKFNNISQEKQTSYLLQLADSLVTPETDCFVGPETFLANRVLEESIDHNSQVVSIKQFLADFPKAKAVLGAMTWTIYNRSANTDYNI